MLDVYRLLTMISERFDEIALYFMRGDDCSPECENTVFLLAPGRQVTKSKSQDHLQFSEKVR
jgi:hypothetical protein